MATDIPDVLPVTPTEVLYCSPEVAVVQLHGGKSISMGTTARGRAESIGDTLAEFLAQGHLLDLTIKDDFREYRMHVIVLTAHSAKHREALVSKGEEAKEITVTGLRTSDCLGHVLEFLYTGHLALTGSTVEDALTIAEQLDLPPVFDQCRKFLGCYEAASALDFLRLATGHKFEDLAAELGRYIRHYPQTALASKAYLDLEGPEAWVAMMGTEDRPCGTELVIFHKFLRWVLHRKEDRLAAAQEVLVKVCWRGIPAPDIASALDDHGDLFDTDELRDTLYEAFKYHALKAVEEGYEPKVADWKNAPFFGVP